MSKKGGIGIVKQLGEYSIRCMSVVYDLPKKVIRDTIKVGVKKLPESQECVNWIESELKRLSALKAVRDENIELLSTCYRLSIKEVNHLLKEAKDRFPNNPVNAKKWAVKELVKRSKRKA